MADKSFGIKELNLIGASGTPTITSPNNLNLNASNVAISTDVTIGRHLDVDGHAEFDAVNVSGVSTFVGNVEFDGTLTDYYGNVGAGTSVLISTGIGVSWVDTASIMQSRTIVSGFTTSIANLGIGNTDITGFKSYSLMKVGLSTTGWLRLYTDSTSRANDASRSIGIDPTPGSGVIAEVVTTGISTTQIISPFVIGGNLDNPADTTIYASIKNLSGSTQSITANLTILQLEA